MDINWDFALYVNMDDKTPMLEFIRQAITQYQKKHGELPKNIHILGKLDKMAVEFETVTIPVVEDTTVLQKHAALYRK